MNKGKYVAYVSTYTTGNKDGIKIFDVDLEQGVFTPKDVVEITNSSYVTISKGRKYLYSITDFGVEAFKILEDGGLAFLNHASTQGMRGCYLSTDYEDKLLFVAGYHDGKITVLRIKEDGSIGEILDEVYLTGMGSVVERSFRPHVNCARVTRDNKYLCAADAGMDQVKVYSINHETGKLRLVDVIRGPQESAPRHIRSSKDGKYMYIVYEIKKCIEVYEYKEIDNNPYFDKLQTVSTLDGHDFSAASALSFSLDYEYLVTTNAGHNSVTVFKQETETGLLDYKFNLPISGSYPKDAMLFPDNRHLVSVNHESNTLTFFKTNFDKNIITMSAKEVKVNKPNAVIFHKIL